MLSRASQKDYINLILTFLYKISLIMNGSYYFLLTKGQVLHLNRVNNLLVRWRNSGG